MISFLWVSNFDRSICKISQQLILFIRMTSKHLSLNVTLHSLILGLSFRKLFHYTQIHAKSFPGLVVVSCTKWAHTGDLGKFEHLLQWMHSTGWLLKLSLYSTISCSIQFLKLISNYLVSGIKLKPCFMEVHITYDWAA